MAVVISPETLENPDFCPVSKSHQHKPDPGSLYVDYDGEAAYVDIHCQYCGRSGCVGQFDPKKVDCFTYSSGAVGDSAFLPLDVRVWAGLGYPDPQVSITSGQTTLSALNDNPGLTFKEIAAIIEDQL